MSVQNRSSQPSRMPLRQRVRWRVLPIVVLLAIIAVVIAFALPQLRERERLQGQRAETMQALSREVVDELSDAAVDVSSLAAGSFVRSYDSEAVLAVNPVAAPARLRLAQRDMLRAMADLITRNPNTYRSAAYLTRDNAVWGEVVNVAGQISLGTNFRARGDEETDGAYNEIINRVLVQGVRFGSPNLVEGIVSIYTPIPVSAGAAAGGILRLDVNLAALADPLRRVSDESSTLYADLRRAFVVDSNNVALAVSDTSLDTTENLAFLRANEGALLDATNGNSLVSAEMIDPYPGESFPWRVVLVDNSAALLVQANNLSIITALVTFGIAVATLILVDRLIGGALRPYTSAVSTAQQRLATTEMSRVSSTQVMRAVAPSPRVSADEATDDQMSDLMRAIDSATSRIDQLHQELDAQTRKRNRDIDVAARIGRETASLVNIDELVAHAIEFISRELGFYHAQVFLIDDVGENAVLFYSQGEAGREMLARKHRIRVGSATVVGRCVGLRHSVAVNDTLAPDSGHGFNELLPLTRAELAMPMYDGDTIIGVLDVQSIEVNAFPDEDLPVYQLLADQLSIAINKAQVIAQNETRVEQINTLNRQMIREAWQSFEDPGIGEFGYQYDLMKVEPLAEHSGNGNAHIGMSVPIEIRGEIIGELFAETPPDEPMTDNHRNLMRAVAERVGLAVENARLFTESQVNLTETRTLYELSRMLNETVSLSEVTQAVMTAAITDSNRALMWLFPESATVDAPQTAIIKVDYSHVARVPTDQRPASFEGSSFRLSEYPYLQTFDYSQVAMIPDIQRDPRIDNNLKQFLHEADLHSGVFVPLYIRDEWLGIALFGFEDARTFATREKRLYPSLIDPLSITVDNRLLFERNEETSARNESLYAASRIINTARDYSDLVSAAMATTTDTELSFSLALLEGEPDENSMWPSAQRVVAFSDNLAVESVNFRHRIRISPTSPMQIREPEIIRDEEGNSPEVSMRVPWLPLATEARFLAIYPLFSANTPIALFYVVSRNPDTLTAEEDTVYRAITGQMSIQLENRRLLQQTSQALEDTRRLYIATRAISSAQTIEDLNYATVDHLARPLAGQGSEVEGLRIMIWSARPDPQPSAPFLELTYEWTTDGQPSRITQDGQRMIFSRAELPIGKLLSDTTTPLVLNVSDFNTERQTELTAVVNLLHANGAAVALMAPITSHGFWFGALILQASRADAFSERYISFAETTAGQLGLALENKMLFAQTESALMETEALYQASRAVSNATSPQDILDAFTSTLLSPDFGHAYLVRLTGGVWDTPGATARVVAEWTSDGSPAMLDRALSEPETPFWSTLSSPTMVLIEDTNNDPDLAEIIQAGSLVVIPLRVQNRQLGALWVSSQGSHTFNDRERRVYQSFGEQASLSLDAALLLEQTNRRAQQLQTSAEVSSAAGRILDLESLLPEVVDLILARFGFDHVQVFLMDERDRFAELRASTGDVGQELLRRRHKLEKGSQSVIGQVTAQARPFIAADTAEADVVHRPNPLLPETRSEMALPLVIKGRVVGALDVQSNQANAFTQDDIAALTTLAAQIATAIDNANLYAEAQDQADRMGLLFEVTDAAARADTLNEALQRVADNLYGSLAVRTVVVYVRRTYEDGMGNSFSALEAEAVNGFRILKADVPRMRISEQGGGALGDVARSRQAMYIPDIEITSGYLPLSDNCRSVILVPFVAGSDLLGVTVLEGENVNEFDLPTQTLLQTLSGSVSSVVQNALLLERLQYANDELRELDKLKSDFLANMSHELRTPLNSIIGFSRMMLKGMSGTLNEMMEQDLTTIYSSGNHLLTVINDILDQAKINAGKMTISSEDFDLKPELEAVKAIALGLVKDKQIDLRMEVAQAIPKVFGDKVRVRQVLLNLVSNATKFTRQGTITIHAYPVTEKGRTWARVDVIDTGIGIDDKDIDMLFEPFRQVDSSLTRTAGGTGLGLPIARSLMELMGGSLNATSEVNVGSTFTVTLSTEAPVAGEKPRTPEPKSTAQDEAKVPAGSLQKQQQVIPVELPRFILIVEDSPEMVDQYRRTLQREGYEIIVASTMLEARAVAPAMQPTIVLMDVNFEGGEGWELLTELKQRDDTRDIPVIVGTLSDERERAEEAGAFAFIQRPYSSDILTEAVTRAVKEASIPRVLLIDDQDDALRMLGDLLRAHGNFRVYTAHNGIEGLQQVAIRRPQLIVLDLRMPEMDGFAVLKELRQNPETSGIPVMVVTSDDTLKPEEQDSLSSVNVLMKSTISQSEYEVFIHGVSENLRLN